jgi:hypothetical protein
LPAPQPVSEKRKRGGYSPPSAGKPVVDADEEETGTKMEIARGGRADRRAQQTSVVSIKEYGSIAVYIRRMAICDSDKDLLPSWARFVRGVIDCPALQPTASRESVHQDDVFESVRQVLAEQLGNGLRKLGIDPDAV